ncbi:capsular biosynthesis protein [Oceanobacter mangrovi]|uniref:capsular biosynthesis protein n=1 Tax=Oceanobacter mangrovi TaxID=2862510 RepID=UPI001C8DBA2D|nr:capsular biosynthesis protein [Oceanobacter mangrovi]
MSVVGVGFYRSYQQEPDVSVDVAEERESLGVTNDSKPAVLLLQGPVGGFFNALAEHLRASSFRVWKVNFNAGDRLFGGGISFRGGLSDWRHWLADFLTANSIDVIVLFGSERPAHVVARKLAQDLGIVVLSLEEGYVRSGFITAERGGNNASSPLAGIIPADDQACLQDIPVRQFKSFSRMSALGAAYYLARSLATHGRSKELFHRRFILPVEVFYWLRNMYRRYRGQASNFHTIERLLEHSDKAFYLVPLQVSVDANLQSAALGWNSTRLISESIHSFSRSAPATTRLVFKVHPMERGHCNYIGFIRDLAHQLGVADRVDVIDIGSMGLLARHSAGMITINSTSGLSAIFHGVPLMVVGKALYANPLLATCAHGEPDFDEFWEGGFVAPRKLRTRYIQWLKQESLIPGDFYVREGMEVACYGIEERILDLLSAKTCSEDVELAVKRSDPLAANA